MFTGIIEAAGDVISLVPHGAGKRLTVFHTFEDLQEGDSIAVNGVCLTVIAPTPAGFHADLSPETIAKTNLGSLETGALVNLERPVTPESRLGGHLVQGHVDGLAEIVALDRLDAEGNHTLKVRIPRELFRYVAWKGSITLDGISLTVASLEEDLAGVAIVPYTFTHTNLSRSLEGEQMNLECDLIARYLERLMRPDVKGALTVERLIEEGY
jgi:riboflavin synthase